jgi:hypothetical protein
MISTTRQWFLVLLFHIPIYANSDNIHTSYIDLTHIQEEERVWRRSGVEKENHKIAGRGEENVNPWGKGTFTDPYIHMLKIHIFTSGVRTSPASERRQDRAVSCGSETGTKWQSFQGCYHGEPIAPGGMKPEWRTSLECGKGS